MALFFHSLAFILIAFLAWWCLLFYLNFLQISCYCLCEPIYCNTNAGPHGSHRNLYWGRDICFVFLWIQNSLTSALSNSMKTSDYASFLGSFILYNLLILQKFNEGFLFRHLGRIQGLLILQVLFACKCTWKHHSTVFNLLYYHVMSEKCKYWFLLFTVDFFPNTKNTFIIESFCPCWGWGPRSEKKCLQSSCHAPWGQSRSTNSTHE